MLEHDLELLEYTLSKKFPTIVLGAGFSLDVKNTHKDDLVTGSKLVEKLYEKLYVNSNEDKAVKNRLRAEQIKSDLKKLCTLIRSEGIDRVEQRNEFLTDFFTIGYNLKDDYHKYFTEYPWQKIYTLNIDNYVENLFFINHKDICAWTLEEQQTVKNKEPVLIKLHGCVKSKNHNYVFDKNEYQQFTANENYLLRDFADSSVKNDVLFLGTEYQESDLQEIIEKYKISGYTNNTDFFFITPKINDIILESEIENNPKYHWIKWTTEEFLTYLHEKIIHDNNISNYMKERGMIFIDEDDNKGSRYYQSSIYTGVESRYADFWQNWDIIYPESVNWLSDIKKSINHLVFNIFGKSYVGKTCVARNLLVNLSRSGYICREYMVSSTESVEYLIDYIKSLPQKTKFALLCENAAYSYHHISAFMEKIPNNIEKCIVITVDTTTNHNRKKYSLEYQYVIEKEISETIDNNYAENIISKLDEHSWLDNMSKFCDKKSDYTKYIKSINDIIELLYLISSGRGFEKHFFDVINKKDDIITKKYFYALIILGRLEITFLPLRIFVNIFSDITEKMDFKKFITEFGDFTTIANNAYIKMRCLRLLEKNTEYNLSHKEIFDILSQVVNQTVGQFTETNINEYSELFQKVLLVNNIVEKKILTLDEIRTLFNTIESKCKCYSYYWVQRGLVEQKLCEFEQAETYFMKAMSIRPQSYQVRHAISKNYMERGLFEVKHNTQQASYYFEIGVKQMTALVEDEKFSKAFSYSIHALADMQFKFADATGIKLSHSECNYLRQKLSLASSDKYKTSMLKKLKNYCKVNNYNDIADYILNG